MHFNIKQTNTITNPLFMRLLYTRIYKKKKQHNVRETLCVAGEVGLCLFWNTNAFWGSILYRYYCNADSK